MERIEIEAQMKVKRRRMCWSFWRSVFSPSPLLRWQSFCHRLRYSGPHCRLVSCHYYSCQLWLWTVGYDNVETVEFNQLCPPWSSDAYSSLFCNRIMFFKNTGGAINNFFLLLTQLASAVKLNGSTRVILRGFVTLFSDCSNVLQSLYVFTEQAFLLLTMWIKCY